MLPFSLPCAKEVHVSYHPRIVRCLLPVLAGNGVAGYPLAKGQPGVSLRSTGQLLFAGLLLPLMVAVTTLALPGHPLQARAESSLAPARLALPLVIASAREGNNGHAFTSPLPTPCQARPPASLPTETARQWLPQLASSRASEASGDSTDADARPQPEPTPDGQDREAFVPILMYHHVAEPQPGWDALRRGLTVSTGLFQEHLDYLRAAGYRSIGLEDLVRHLTLGEPLPPKPVILTFDDGYRDHYTNAYPLLVNYGFTATFFLVTAPIDQGSPEFLTWEMVREMHQHGMSFGAHTYTHPDLRGQTTDYLVWQIVGSAEAIEARIGEKVRFFAYPSGAYDDNVIAVLRSAGFWAALTTEYGCHEHSKLLWTLPRIRVTPEDTATSLAAKLSSCTPP